MVHHMQKARSINLHKIASWIADIRQENPEAEIDVQSLERKAMLVLGCSERKAKEYIQIIEPDFYGRSY